MIDSYSLVEHFDYMKNYIPQPFFINNDDVKEIVKSDNELDEDYIIKTSKYNYTLSKASLKKLVDALGVKYKLLSAVCSETNVLEYVLPIVNKLFKCFADCFVFYANSDDVLTIIDLNVNTEKGDEGTKYENGPSPWLDEAKKDSSLFTCFSGFMNKLEITPNDTDILVVADDIMSSATNVSFSMFKSISGAVLQPMLIFSSKFSNLDGFSEIHPAMYDDETGITISFPTNYAKVKSENTSGEVNSYSFSYLWDNRAKKIQEHTDVNDYIFTEINELQVSSDSPNSVKKFIQDIVSDNILNLNQPIRNILNDAKSASDEMKPSKRNKFKKQIGSLIGWCITMKHSGCSSCGHLTV